MSECGCGCSEKLEQLKEEVEVNSSKIDYLENSEDVFENSQAKLFFDDLPNVWPFSEENVLESSCQTLAFEADDLDMLLEYPKKLQKYDTEYFNYDVEENGQDEYKFIIRR